MVNKNAYGNVNLENDVFKDIAYIATEKVSGVYPMKSDKSFASVSVKDGNLKLTLKIKVKTGVDVVKVCNKLTSQVHEAIETMTGIDCKTIDIDIQGFKNEDNKQAK